MAVLSKAGQIVFYNLNYTRPNSTIIFPDVNSTTYFTFSFWIQIYNTIPGTIFSCYATDGSAFVIDSDGTYLYLTTRQGSTGLGKIPIVNVTLNKWMVLCVVKAGPNFDFYFGIEDLTIPSPWTVPVTLTYINQIPTTLNFATEYIAIACYNNMAICNFKFWNAPLNLAQIQEQVHRWDSSPGTSGGPAPMWSSTLRAPSDTASIVNPLAGPTWVTEHAFTLISPSSDNLVMTTDPEYMANQMLCPTWVYPIGYIVPESYYAQPPTSVITDSSYNPGTTPTIPTTYKATQLFQFSDRGSVPITDTQIVSIRHLGYVSHSGTGIFASDTWGLYHDDNGTEILPNQSDPTNRFEQTTLMVIPGTIKATTMYQWKFGAQFTYQPQPSPTATATSHLTDIRLYVIYIGFPTDAPTIHFENTAGLFAIKKGSTVDTYNNGFVTKIPDPTFATAYIGE